MLNCAPRLLCAIISFEIYYRINPLSIHVKKNKKGTAFFSGGLSSYVSKEGAIQKADNGLLTSW
jgi:hypothetical protein